MEIDFSALASRVAAFSDVLGCIILSNDGLVLGAFPPADGDGDGIKGSWLRFAAVGEPERGFLKIEDQVWAYVTVGTYAAFAVAGGATRPGVLLDHLEQALLVAGESRESLSVARAPGRVELVAGSRPKAVAEEPVRGESKPSSALDMFQAAGNQPVPVPADPEPAAEHHPERYEHAEHQEQPEHNEHNEHKEHREGEHGPEQEHEGSPEIPEDAEIDPVALAREFAGLLQEDRRGDENNG